MAALICGLPYKTMSKKNKNKNKDINTELNPDTCNHVWCIFSMHKLGDKIRAYMYCNRCGLLRSKIGAMHKFLKIDGFADAKRRM